MAEDADLPPDQGRPLSAFGWTALAFSVCVPAALAFFGWAVALGCYLTVIAVIVLGGIPGGMLYQADIDLYLAKHPQSMEDLPWPRSYFDLSKRQKWRYARRGLSRALAHGLLMPAALLLGLAVFLRVADADVVETLLKK